MGFDGYLSFGGIEIINAERTTAYVNNLLPAFPLVRRTHDYDNIHVALGHEPYRTPVLDGADWVESSPSIAEAGPHASDYVNPTHGFYGLYPLSVQGIGDSTMRAEVTEGLLDGGFIGAERDSTRSIRVRGLLIGENELAVEAGLNWLRNALRRNACAMHGDQCGYSDLDFFLAPPNVCVPLYSSEFVEEVTHQLAGPLSPSTSPINSADGRFFPVGQRVRWAWDLPPLDGVVVRWGGELTDGTLFDTHGPVTLRRSNFFTNPKFATGTTGWTSDGTITQDTGFQGTFARVEPSDMPEVRVNWAPEPSFENGDPESFGWRGSGNVSAVADGAPPQGSKVASVPADPDGNWLEFTALGPNEQESCLLSFWQKDSTGGEVIVTAPDGTVVDSVVMPPGIAGWKRYGAQIEVRRGYNVRIVADGAQDLLIDGVMLEAGVGIRTNYYIAPKGGFGVSWTATSLTTVDNTSTDTFAGWPASSPESIKLTATSNLGARTLTLQAASSAQASAGQAWGARARLAAAPGNAATRTGLFQLVAYDASNALIGTFGSSETPSLSPGAVVDVEVTGTAPANTAKVGIRWGRNASGANGDAFYLDDILMTRLLDGETDVPDYFDGDSPDGQWDSLQNLSQSHLFPSYFDGDTADGGGITYEYLGSSSASPSRASDGVFDPVELESAQTTSGNGPAVASVYLRGVNARPSVTLELIDPDDNVVSSVPANVGLEFQRYAVGTSFGAQLRLRVTSDAPFDIRDAMLENASAVNEYFDGDDAAPDGYSIYWDGAPNGSVSRYDYTGGFAVEASTGWRPYLYADAGSINAVYYNASFTGEVPLEFQLRPYARTYHKVATTVGVRSIMKHHLSIGAATEVDFVLTAANPHAFTTHAEELFDSFVPAESELFEDYVMNLATNPSPQVASTGWGQVSSGSVSGTRSSSNGFDGDYGYRITFAASADAADAYGFYGRSTEDDIPVVPGQVLTARLSARSSASRTTKLQVAFYDASNSLVSTVDSGNYSMTGGQWTEMKLANITVPSDATHAQIRVRGVTTNWANTQTLDIDHAALMNEDRPYFDGEEGVIGTAEFAWTGDAYASASILIEHEVDLTSLVVDPDLPALPEPPAPPTIPDLAVDRTQIVWRRYYFTVDAADVPLWANTIPTLVFYTQGEDVRQLRVRFHPNPFGWDPEKVDPTSFCAEFILSYLPENSALTVTGVSEQAWASVAGSPPIPANHLLYGTGGSPMAWPELSCHIPYVMTIDVPTTLDEEDIAFSLSINRRE